MRRGLSFAQVLGVAVVAGWCLAQSLPPIFTEMPACAAGAAGQGGVTVSGNGDVNGDNGLDLSDAVYLLSFLFQGGEPPMDCPGGAPGAGGGAAPSPLPATNPEFCYDGLAQAACVAGLGTLPDGVTCGGDDLFYDAGCPLAGRFDDSAGDGTVKDNCTNLMWQQASAFIQVGDTRPSWCEALRYCETLDLGDNGMAGLYNDWRMPNIRELHSIYELLDNGARAHSPPFDFVNGETYWSSTHRTQDPPNVLIVSSTNGDIKFGVAGGSSAVRAVRTILPTDAGGAAGAGRGQGGVTVSGNGDVNGDNGLDLSDAIYLLSFLFQGGDPLEPCPDVTPQAETDCGDENCCGNGVDDDLDGATDCIDADCAGGPSCPVGDPGLLPDTGQTICTNEAGMAIPCDDIDCPGQDGFYSTGCPRAGEVRFVLNDGGTPDVPGVPVDDTVTDNCTGLMWQRDTADIDGGGVDPDASSGDRVSWCEALDYCESTADGFAGHDDWRLPNVRELQSIVDYGRYNPSIHPIFTQVEQVILTPVDYWTSTSQQGFLAWHYLSEVGLFQTSGGEKEDDPTRPNNKEHATFFVRAVRNAP